MFWDLPLDDFSGAFCGEGKYPLISAVAKELGDYNPPPPPTPRPIPPTTQAPVTEAPPKTETPVTQAPKTHGPGEHGCHAIGVWKGNPKMDQWCVDNCRLGNCPASICECT